MKDLIHVFGIYPVEDDDMTVEAYFIEMKRQLRARTFHDLVLLIKGEIECYKDSICDYEVAGISFDLPYNVSMRDSDHPCQCVECDEQERKDFFSQFTDAKQTWNGPRRSVARDSDI